MKFKVTIDKSRCKGCRYCVDACESAVLAMSESLNLKGYYYAEVIRVDACAGCRKCADMCPDVAIEIEQEE